MNFTESSYRCLRCKGKRPEGTSSEPSIIDDHDYEGHSFCRCKVHEVEIQGHGGLVIRENAAAAAENVGQTSKAQLLSKSRRPRLRIVPIPNQQAHQTSVSNPVSTSGADPAPGVTRDVIMIQKPSVVIPREIYKRLGLYKYRGISYVTGEEHEGGCCICQEDYEINVSEIGFLECDHEFHYRCIIKWLTRSNTCPICRSKGLQVKGRHKYAA